MYLMPIEPYATEGLHLGVPGKVIQSLSAHKTGIARMDSMILARYRPSAPARLAVLQHRMPLCAAMLSLFPSCSRYTVWLCTDVQR